MRSEHSDHAHNEITELDHTHTAFISAKPHPQHITEATPTDSVAAALNVEGAGTQE